MPSFEPGTRVLARPPNKHIWRTAKVVNPPPNLPPDTIAVKFVGKTTQVNLPSRNVKLASDRSTEPPPVDLTTDTDNNSTALPAFSDPWSGESQKQSATSPSQSIDQPFPSPSISDSGSDTPHVQPRSTLIPQQSSRDWLLAQHATRTDRNRVTTQSEPRFQPPQRQPQVVQDPSFPAAPYPVYPRGNLGASSSDVLRDPLANESPQKAHPQSFQFTPIRTGDKTSSQALPLSVPTSLSPRPQIPLRSTTAIDSQNTSHSHYVPFQGSSKPVSSVPLRNGLTIRNDERHPRATGDEPLSIPRVAVPQNGRLARHPQGAFDDDIPIRRNPIPRHFVGNGAIQISAGRDGAAHFYAAYKRRRVRYDFHAYDQMPPPLRPESPVGKLSRRLAKRERERGGEHQKNSREVQLLPYQRPLQPEEATVRIAPGFDSSQAFAASLEGTSDMEAKVLEEVFAALSVKAGGNEDANDKHLQHMARKPSTLTVRGGGRKKRSPKKWRYFHHAKTRDAEASSAFNLVESVGGSSPVQDQAAVSWDRPLDCSVREHEGAENFPMPRVYGCSCQGEIEEHMPACTERYSIQCCICMLWFHIGCIGLEPSESIALRGRTANGKEQYICIQCVDEHVALGSVAGSRQRPLFDKVFHEGTKWISSVHAVSELISGLSIIATDTSLHSSSLANGRSSSAWSSIREALAHHEISARVNNLEQLREGVTNASVGIRERVLFDDLLGDRGYQPEDLDYT